MSLNDLLLMNCSKAGTKMLLSRNLFLLIHSPQWCGIWFVF